MGHDVTHEWWFAIGVFIGGHLWLVANCLELPDRFAAWLEQVIDRTRE